MAGILAILLAFSHASLFMALLCIFLIFLVCTYSIHNLVKSTLIFYKLIKGPSSTFVETAEKAFLSVSVFMEKWVCTIKGFINFFVIFDLIGCCSIYVLFVAKLIVEHYTSMDEHLDIRHYIAILLSPIIISSLIRNVKHLNQFSMKANVLVAATVGITFYYVVQDFI